MQPDQILFEFIKALFYHLLVKRNRPIFEKESSESFTLTVQTILFY